MGEGLSALRRLSGSVLYFALPVCMLHPALWMMHVMGSVRCAGVGGTAVGDTEQVQQPCDQLGLCIGIKHKHLQHGTYTIHVQPTTYDISLASVLHALCGLAHRPRVKTPV